MTDGSASYNSEFGTAFSAVLELHGIQGVRQRRDALIQFLHVSASVVYTSVHGFAQVRWVLVLQDDASNVIIEDA